MNAMMTMRAEKFEPEFKPADMMAHFLGKRDRAVEPGHIQGEIDRVAHL